METRSPTEKSTLVVGVAVCLLATSFRIRGPELLYVMACIGVVHLAITDRKSAAKLHFPLALAGLCLWGLASFGWSANPMVAVKPTLALVATAVITVALCCLSDVGLLRALRTGAVLAVGLNVVFQFISPDEATSTLEGGTQWRGLMPHKQQLGLLAGFACFVLAHALWADKRHRNRWTMFLVLSLVVMLNARSSVVMVSAVAAVGAVFGLMATHRMIAKTQGVLLALMCTAAVLIVIQISTAIEGITDVTGKDVTLTGRTLLWPHVIEQIESHPLVGVGLNSVWRIAPDSSSADPITTAIRRATGWGAYSAHNGYLDVALQLGVVGLVLLGSILVGGMVAYVRRRPVPDGPRMIGAFAFFYIIFLSLAESFIFTAQGFFLAVFAVLMSRRNDVSHDRRGHISQAAEPRAPLEVHSTT